MRSAKGIASYLTAALLFTCVASAEPGSSEVQVKSNQASSCLPLFQHQVRKLHSKQMVDLCEVVENKVVLVVNTASNCGFTPQFKGLEALYQEYAEQGLVIIGFPSDDFFQEEGDEKDTAEVCYQNYGVSFPMFATTSVRGGDAHPLFAQLAEQTASPKWNFYKYLVSRDGSELKHFSSRVTPDDDELKSLLVSMLKGNG